MAKESLLEKFYLTKNHPEKEEAEGAGLSAERALLTECRGMCASESDHQEEMDAGRKCCLLGQKFRLEFAPDINLGLCICG